MRALALFWLLGGHGLVLMLAVRWREPRASRLIPAGIFVATATTAVLGLVLGAAGAFSPVALGLLTLPSVLLAGVRRQTVADNLSRLDFDVDTWWALGLGAAFLAFITLLPHWNFLYSPNLDAGNYELYGNHLATTGRLGLDVGALREAGAPVEWLVSRNTWYESTAKIWQPAYFFAYPVLLAVAKAVMGTPEAGWFVNAFLGALGASLLFLLVRRFLDDRRLAVATTGVVLASFGFLLYSRQLMSEMVALTALIALVWALTDHAFRHETLPVGLVASAAVAVSLLARIDSFQVLAAVSAATLAGALSGDRIRLGGPAGGAIGAVIGTALAITTVSPIYLKRAELRGLFPPLSETSIGDTSLLVPSGAAIVLLFAGAAVVEHRRGDRAPSGWGTSALGAMAWIVTAALVILSVWALALRWQGSEFPASYDDYNFLRLLLFLPPPLVLAGFVVGAPTLRTEGVARWILLGLACAVGLVILRSRHGFADMWWIRRFIVPVVPLAAMAGAVVVRELRHRRSLLAMTLITATVAASYWLRGVAADLVDRPAVSLDWMQEVVVVAMATTLVVYATRLRQTRLDLRGPLLFGLGCLVALELAWSAPIAGFAQNQALPDQLADLRDAVPADAVVVAQHGPTIFRGTVNLFRSVHEPPVLLNVADRQVDTAIDVVQRATDGRHPVRVLTDGRRPQLAAGSCLENEVTYTPRWQNRSRGLLLEGGVDLSVTVHIFRVGSCDEV